MSHISCSRFDLWLELKVNGAPYEHRYHANKCTLLDLSGWIGHELTQWNRFHHFCQTLRFIYAPCAHWVRRVRRHRAVRRLYSELARIHWDLLQEASVWNEKASKRTFCSNTGTFTAGGRRHQSPMMPQMILSRFQRAVGLLLSLTFPDAELLPPHASRLNAG